MRWDLRHRTVIDTIHRRRRRCRGASIRNIVSMTCG